MRPDAAAPMLSTVLRPLPAMACVLAACAAPPRPPAVAPPPALPTPAPAAVANVPAGRAVAAGLATGAPDEAPFRAMAIWWREALRQSSWLRITDDSGGGDRLELTVDPRARTATATWRHADGPTVLATIAFPDGDVPAAIDRLAVAARAAVGDATPATVACAAGVSARHEVVDAVADAIALLRDGGYGGARGILRAQRRRDARAPWLLEPLAACEAALGDHATALRLCDEALAETARLLPSTDHRLRRARLLALAALHPADAAAHDAELLALATTARADRPHDLEPLRSLATAHALRGEFAAAAPLADELLAADPDAANARLLAGYTALALGAPAAAADHFAAVRGRLPAATTLLPHACALFAAGQRDALRALLDRAVDDAVATRDPLEVDARRVRAALCLAAGDDPGLRAELRAILAWLVARPLALQARADEFQAQAALLAERGDADEVARLLALVDATPAAAALAPALAALRRALPAGDLAALRVRAPDDRVCLRGPWNPPLRGPEWQAATRR